jgi:hypothetical protein
VFCCPEFKPFSKLWQDLEIVCSVLWNEDEFSDDCDMGAKFLSDSEDSSEDEDTVYDEMTTMTCSVRHGKR